MILILLTDCHIFLSMSVLRIWWHIKAINKSWKVLGPCISDLEVLVFVEGGKPENPDKNPRSKDENQQQTQPTYDGGSGNRTRAT